MKLFYEKSIFFLYAFLIFFVPLIFTNLTVESYEFPKIMLIYFLGSVIILEYFAYNYYVNGFPKKTTVIQHNKWLFFILPFLLTYLFSTIFSNNLYTSFWGYYGRFNGGLLSIIFFFLLFYISTKVFDSHDFNKLFVFLLFSTAVVSIYGIFQHFGWAGVEKLTRVYSSFGQPNWLAQFLIMILPVVIYLYTSKNVTLHKNEEILLLILYSLVFTCFWFSFSLSSILGLFVSLAFLNKGDFKKYLHILLISVLIVCTNYKFFENRVHDVFIDIQKIISTNFVAYAETEYMVSDTGLIRKDLWIGTLKLYISSPKIFFIGIGPQTFAYVFPKYRAASLNYSSEWDYVINKPHNYYLEILVELGLLGLISYVYFLYVFLIKSPRFLKPTIVGFIVSNFFGWPAVCTNLLFFLILGYVFYEKNK